MTAEIKQFSDPADLAAYINTLYGGGSTTVTVTVVAKSVYLIQSN
jgi:hypothetical protein